jgi:hypothetical protein
MRRPEHVHRQHYSGGNQYRRAADENAPHQATRPRAAAHRQPAARAADHALNLVCDPRSVAEGEEAVQVFRRE